MFLWVRATSTVSNWAIVITARASHLPHRLGQPSLFHLCYLQFCNQDLGVPLDLRESTEELRIDLSTPSRGPPDRFWLPYKIRMSDFRDKPASSDKSLSLREFQQMSVQCVLNSKNFVISPKNFCTGEAKH